MSCNYHSQSKVRSNRKGGVKIQHNQTCLLPSGHKSKHFKHDDPVHTHFSIKERSRCQYCNDKFGSVTAPVQPINKLQERIQRIRAERAGK